MTVIDLVADAVRLLRNTPHQYRYTLGSDQMLRAFITQVRDGLGYDAGRLRWRLDGHLTGEPSAVLWFDRREAREPPLPW